MAEITNTNDSGKGRKIRSQKLSTKIDMTPMVDLGFLLITFFMLTTSLSKPVILDLAMPCADCPSGPIRETTALTVLLGANNKVYYYQGMVGTAEPKETNFSSSGLRRILAESRQRIGNDFVVVIKPSNVSKYHNVIDLIDELTITNVKRYAIVDISPTELAMIE
jgi:biopolymer transport protein ExbD